MSKFRRRDDRLNSSRQLDEEMDSETTSQTESETTKTNFRQPFNRRYKRVDMIGRIMYSEWLLERPENFEEQWLMVPAPKGKRGLLIFNKNYAEIYNKNGEQIERFKYPISSRSSITLDVLIDRKSKKVYIIDLVEADYCDGSGSDFECRRFMLQTVLESADLLSKKCSDYSFELMPAIKCSNSAMEEFMTRETHGYTLDGLMFYHKQVGIIGGTGLEDPDLFNSSLEVRVPTPYGEPSDALKIGTINGISCVLLSRHSRDHSIEPSGCHCIIASNASGSLIEEIQRGDFVFCDSFIDRTYKRAQTFYDGVEGHGKGCLIETAEEQQISHHKTGVILCIEGPRYSSRAESLMFRKWGATVINMTAVPEVVLARELGIPYANVALSTDYDCWKDDEELVSVDLVARTLKENGEKAKKLFVGAVAKIGKNAAEILKEYEKEQATAKAAIM
ncbi:S-methyl-5'-thioadenosine phosphorylase [Aphelenchoides besseyi]|nr:S-methyl-5'-thioadenosine phosphorylase [Aphelenchoides besseyi]